MAELPAYPTDAAMCRLLAEGPLPSAAIAGRLAMPGRTVRHRLYQLRRAGIVVTSMDGLHRLAAPDVLDLAAPDGDLAASVGGGDRPASDGPSPRHGGHWGARTVLAAAALALVGGLAVALVSRRTPSPPSPPAPLWGFGNAGSWEARPPW
jgi:hypothetical protein